MISIYFIIINIIGLSSMYIDKKKAIKNKWRIKETTLLAIAIIGGSIGSIIGMYSFRHKTKHIKFTLGIPFIILLQLLLFYFYML
ncbi:DUF1294 domain-containing protein [Clostridioides sp. ES-S-0190-01]|nr:DUF1294 domain-containing protein [Clostridioides sp. ES-S-0001-02]MCC0653606.1 DUF1294 domain-containing protein [Clostridioides sp. ES-S-0001-03]MCC0655353.1 DUF1294 domain-containing protein [Clostridioides sp. ES-S-0123-01]MCC0696477.1 DUF1294 domain-containing protein [Clostridioides sp. ES-S-0048-02]MCC0706953.1 DUF1294 domain-containing protein [Clostridioides sp. ES-S-0190-01]UDN60164.1 DUF1294 domain-containing protein [Clostridioides sp. ES-S-0010-02]UDN63849.1 DUF1294 domain-con